ncbi:MAG: Asp-tRNA(Asn)/Glu-tRNA(Gln) amidotransferase subunit GatC [Patescibacteria group bacterium]|nr:Asp-tRNA(Asn)/Glu-tRNA(Gln) amidotransferase subunit GatC [Patescibacteria group bacterium]
MAKISKEEIEHTAALARLKSDGENLEEILDYVAECEKAPTDEIEAISQISNLKNVSRTDEVEKSLPVEKVLQNAPAKQDNYIKTKQIFE